MGGDELAEERFEGGIGVVESGAAGGDVGGLEAFEDGSEGNG